MTPRPATALVTGAARRIGAEIVRDLAAHGWRVVLHYRHSETDAEATAAAARDAGGEAITLAADLSDDAQADALLDRAANALGEPVGALVNNASVFAWDDVHTATRASWDAHMESNLRAPFAAAQAFVRHLPGDTAGDVVNLLDGCVWNYPPDFTSYTVSKAGLWTLTQALAKELAPRIRVNAVGPGPALPSRGESQAAFERTTDRLPLGRGTSPGEVAEAVRFILGAPAMTGQMIALDGGRHLGWQFPAPASA